MISSRMNSWKYYRERNNGCGNDSQASRRSFFECSICFDVASEPVVTYSFTTFFLFVVFSHVSCFLHPFTSSLLDQHLSLLLPPFSMILLFSAASYFSQFLILSPCGHLFCWPCLFAWMERKGDPFACPVCKASVTESEIVPLYARDENTEGKKRGEVFTSILPLYYLNIDQSRENDFIRVSFAPLPNPFLPCPHKLIILPVFGLFLHFFFSCVDTEQCATTTPATTGNTGVAPPSLTWARRRIRIWRRASLSNAHVWCPFRYQYSPNFQF